MAKKLAILNELYQTLKDQDLVRRQILCIIDEHCTVLSSYLDDHEFSKFKRDHKFKEYLIYYSFNDVQYLYKMILLHEQRIAQLLDYDKNSHTELNHRKQSVMATALAYKQKQEEREKTVKNSASETDTKHLIDLLNLEEQLYKHRQKLDELRLKEIERKVQLLETKKFIVEEQLKILKHELRRIKPSVKITEADLTVARESLAKERQEHIRLAEVNRKRLNIILAERQEKEKTLTALSKRFNIALNNQVDTWRVQPQDTLSSYVGICQVGALNSYLLLLDTKRMHIDLLGILDDFKLSNEQLQIRVKESFYKIGARKFISQEAIVKEMQLYEAPKADARANLSLYRAKMNEIDELCKQQREIIDSITILRQNLGQQQTKIFRNAAKEYFTCLEVINHAELAIKERIEILKKINSTYASIVSEIEKTLRHISFIISELNSITIWHRPDYAISWQGIKQAIPDLEFFMFDMFQYLKSINVSSIVTTVRECAAHPRATAAAVLWLVLLIMLTLIYARCGGTVVKYIISYRHSTSDLVAIVISWCAALLLFVHTMLYILGPWSIVGFLLYMYRQVVSAYIVAWFYLLTIGCFMVLVTYFKRHLIDYNLSHGYTLLSAEFQRRFILVITTLLYGEVLIGGLYYSFLTWTSVSNYGTSEVPAILLAGLVIMFQIGLILLVSKKRLLAIVPEYSEVWRFFRAQLNRYYVIFVMALVVVIVLGNPYVGFGRLMVYLLRGIFSTVLLMGVVLWVYGWIKNVISRIFFIRDGEVVREKFEHAKSWFGILVIALFLCFSILCCFMVARIWGSSLTLHEMSIWLHKPLIADLKPPITTWSILHLIMFVMAGFLVSYGFDHFVLDKIFDLLLVDMGVQYTITSIARYLIVIAAIFLGFQQVGLGSLIVYIVGVLALGIGWILKEPISDFVAYFIILVQRPVKIGDYIQIDENTMGVVRRISPRALVLRRRNSTTIVVPNSYLVNRTITNWNYVRKYIAFDDITLTIHFTEDPELVRQILHEATQSHPKVLKNPSPIVRLDNFGEYGYQFMVRGFVSDVYTLDQWDIASEVRFVIVKKLRENNISIAIPVWAQTQHKDRQNGGRQSSSGGSMPYGGNIKE